MSARGVMPKRRGPAPGTNRPPIRDFTYPRARDSTPAGGDTLGRRGSTAGAMDIVRHGRPALASLLAWLALLLPAHAAGAAPEGGEILTLERAVGLALAGNWHLAIMDARVEAAAAAVDGRRADRLPRLDATTGYSRTDNPVAVFGNLLLQERFGPGNFAIDRLNRPPPLDDWSAGLETTYALWSGGRLRHALAAAEHGLAGSEASRVRARHEVVAEVVARYGAVVVADHGLDAARDAVTTADAHVALARDRVETGVAVASDLLLAEVRASAAQEAAVHAANSLELARAALNLVLGRDLGTPFTLAETLPAEIATSDDSLDERVERASRQRPDLDAARSRADALASQAEAVGAGRRPRLDLRAGVEAHAESPADDAGISSAVGLRLAIPLLDGGRIRASRHAADARVREAEAELARLREAVAFELRAAFLARRSAEQRLRLADAAGALAARSLSIVEDRYREGLITVPELLDAQLALADARARRVAAERDLILANAQLDLAAGDLRGDLRAER